MPDFKIQRAVVSMHFKRAEQKLRNRKGDPDASKLQEFLEQEYQQFRQHLQDWNAISQGWMETKKARLAAQKEALQHNLAEQYDHLHEAWEHTRLRSRLKELEYALKMQRKRLEALTLQMA